MSKSAILSQTFTLRNEFGLHAVPASLFVRKACEFQAEVEVALVFPNGKTGTPVPGKSIMGLLTLGAMGGSVLLVSAKGEDARAAVDELGAMIESGFGES